MSDFVFVVEGLDDALSIENIPKDIIQAARRAVSKATKRARAESAREINRQVNFPARYLEGRRGRLNVSKLPKGNDLEGIVQGRARPTSLARFALGTPESTRRARGVRVQVKPGSVAFLPGAFLLRLKSGTSAIDTRNNLGLAVRTRDGRPPRTAYKPVKVDEGLYLLYGPSVDQVFGRERGVAQKVGPEVADFLEDEFLRLLDL